MMWRLGAVLVLLFFPSMGSADPGVGDPVYGRPRYDRVRDPILKKMLSEFPRQALHAERIAFRHPASNEPMEILAPVPADMMDLIAVIETATLRLSS